MPNWCNNSVRIRGPVEEVKKLKDALSQNDNTFDFNAILPVPKGLLNTSAPAQHNESPQKVAFNVANYGAADWYDWCVNKWGTKWNATDAALAEEEEYTDGRDMLELAYSFDTAWAPPIPVYEALAKQHPNLEVYACYDEPGQGFSGWVFYEGGETKSSREYDDSFYGIKAMMEPTGEVWDYVK